MAYEVERCLGCDSYNIGSHGDAVYNHHADLPAYTTMFYFPSNHETFSEIKYDKLELGYDNHLREIRDIVRGAPLEAYLPISVIVPVGPGRNSAIVKREGEDIRAMPDIIEEIIKAQAEVTGRKEPVIVKMTEINEELLLRRRVSKVEILKKDKE